MTSYELNDILLDKLRATTPRNRFLEDGEAVIGIIMVVSDSPRSIRLTIGLVAIVRGVEER